MAVTTISVGQLSLAFIPVAIVVFLMWRWHQGVAKPLQAIARMLLQLTLIGYVLVFIFESNSAAVIGGVLSIMLLAASWLALNTIDPPRRSYFGAALLSVTIAGGSTLALITQGVLQLDPWYQPNVIIPLAGMIFSASMTNISLAIERLIAEMANGRDFVTARDTAFRTSMIPIINSFLAVGLISLPGMMTGQILSGVSPLVAVRYQIMVMCMIFGAGGLATVIFLSLIRTQPRFASESAVPVDS